jgi:hypothetical protein
MHTDGRVRQTRSLIQNHPYSDFISPYLHHYACTSIVSHPHNFELIFTAIHVHILYRVTFF